MLCRLSDHFIDVPEYVTPGTFISQLILVRWLNKIMTGRIASGTAKESICGEKGF